jgi:hypothetical protein
MTAAIACYALAALLVLLAVLASRPRRRPRPSPLAWSHDGITWHRDQGKP